MGLNKSQRKFRNYAKTYGVNVTSKSRHKEENLGETFGADIDKD